MGYTVGRKVVVEDCSRLSLPDLRRVGALTPGKRGTLLAATPRHGSARWLLADRAGFEVDAGVGTLTLRFRLPDGRRVLDVTERVELVRTALYHGGKRLWLSCPVCGQRCAFLQRPPGETVFRCRRCPGHELSYQSRLS